MKTVHPSGGISPFRCARIGLAQAAVLRMTNLDRYREVLVCTAAVPLGKDRQAHVPLWAPVMVDGGVFLERLSRSGRAEVDAFEALVTVGRLLIRTRHSGLTYPCAALQMIGCDIVVTLKPALSLNRALRIRATVAPMPILTSVAALHDRAVAGRAAHCRLL